jgi:hypothetical protein
MIAIVNDERGANPNKTIIEVYQRFCSSILRTKEDFLPLEGGFRRYWIVNRPGGTISLRENEG